MPFVNGAYGRVPYRFWAARRPLAGFVFLHGAGDDSARYQRLALALNERQVSVWATDGIGRGGGARTDSFDVIVHGARLVSDFAHARLAGAPLALGGHSLGGTAAALTATRVNTAYAGLVLSGTPIDPLRQVDAVPERAPVSLDLTYLYSVRGEPLGGQVATVSRTAVRVAWAELAATFAGTPLPVLFVHGEHDSIVPIGGSRAWAGRLRHGQLARFERARHDVANASHRVATTIADFVLSVALSDAAA